MDKISFNIASLSERESNLVKTIDSIIDQVDVVNLCLNSYEANPYPHEKVNVVFSDNRYGDAGKFMFLEDFKGYYFTGDDDLIYPPTYVYDMIKEIDDCFIVTHHARSFDKFPIKSYYKSPAIKHRCLGEEKELRNVQFGGTGVMGFHTDYFKPSFDIFKRANMADIWIGIEAHKQNKMILALPHSEDYFKYQHVPNTIYEVEANNCDYQTEIVNKYFNS